TFRTRPSGAAVNPLADDAARFFNGTPTPASTLGIIHTPFDVAALRGALPVSPAPAVSHAASGWAADFARASGASTGANWALQMQAQSEIQKGGIISPAPQMPVMGDTMQHSRPMPYGPMGMMNIPSYNQYQPVPPQNLQQAEPQIVFPDIQSVQSAPVVQSEPTTTTSTSQDRSELAETARQLLNALQNETRPKFKNSQFMGLMRQLRDGEVVVQDGEMVPTSEARPVEVLDKGKGKASTEGWATEFANGGLLHRRKSVHFDTADPSTSYQIRTEDQTMDEEDAAFDNADVFYDIYNRTHRTAKLPDAQANEWAQLQDDWDAFEATASGIRPVESKGYQFQKNNPYLSGTRTHELHRHGAGLQQVSLGLTLWASMAHVATAECFGA
ncbi:hypothetical protein FRC12_022378, partial [Ceratobasidium sp. 428]